MKHSKHKNKGRHRASKPASGDERHLQGIDEKSFVLNDVVTMSSTGLATGRQYLVRIACDLNGWAWSVVEASGNVNVSSDT